MHIESISRGNNGGDGLALLRALAERVQAAGHGPVMFNSSAGEQKVWIGGDPTFSLWLSLDAAEMRMRDLLGMAVCHA